MRAILFFGFLLVGMPRLIFSQEKDANKSDSLPYYRNGLHGEFLGTTILGVNYERCLLHKNIFTLVARVGLGLPVVVVGMNVRLGEGKNFLEFGYDRAVVTGVHYNGEVFRTNIEVAYKRRWGKGWTFRTGCKIILLGDFGHLGYYFGVPFPFPLFSFGRDF